MTSEQEVKAKELVGQIATFSIQAAWFAVYEKSKELNKLLEGENNG